MRRGEQTCIVADRERVHIDLESIEVDSLVYRNQLLSKDAELTLQELGDLAVELESPLLDGLDMPNQPMFQAWLTAEREDLELLYVKVLRRLVNHSDVSKSEAVKWSRIWFERSPFSEEAAQARISSLREIGKAEEADQVAEEFNTALQQAGVAPKKALANTEKIDEPLIEEKPNRALLRSQTIKFCKTPDDVRIAYATVGSGPPIVKAANWLNHLELDWDSPIWGDLFQALAANRSFIRYDERGNGLSDWDVEEINQAAFVRDLEAVVDELNLESFPLLGISQGCAVSIEYAVRHPSRVSALILVSGYASGWRIGATPDEQERREAVMTLTRHGWGMKNPAYRRIFSQTFMPDAQPTELDWFDEFQRQTTSAENAVRFQQAFADIDVRELLSQVKVPTIVFHARDDQRISLEQGRELAIGIPNARFVPLESKNHILLGHEPAWEIFVRETLAFLEEHKL